MPSSDIDSPRGYAIMVGENECYFVCSAGFSMFQKIRKLDYKVTDRITKLHCPFLDKVMVIATYAGTGALIWWVTLALPFIIIKEYRHAGVMLITALGINYLLGEIIIKKSVGRDRPSEQLSDEELKVHRPKDHSFPSGHTASSFCAFTITFWNSITGGCPELIWIPALFVAALIGFSRLYLRVHYLSDVIGGFVLGIIDGTLIYLFFRYVIFV